MLALVIAAALALPSAFAANTTTAQAGNITNLDILIIVGHTINWQGFAGHLFFGTNASAPNILNATGSDVNASNLFIQITCNNPTSVSGFVIFSNTSAPPSGLVAGDLSILDTLSNGSDSATMTFTTTSTFNLPSGAVANVPTTFTCVNQTRQNTAFREGYFNQGNDIVFITAIESNLTGYNSSAFDFQSLLFAANQTTVAYYVFSDITFTCPGVVPPVGGAGGGSGGYPGGCIVFWECDPWGDCMPDGMQHRDCRPRVACPNMTERLKPATAMSCRQVEPREELPEIISESRILWSGFLGNLTLTLLPQRGYILDEALMSGTFQNNNYLSVEEISYQISTPGIYTAFANVHPAPMVLWNTMIGGWKDHGKAETRALDWKVIRPEPLPRLRPRKTEPYRFMIIPPVMQPKTVEIGVSAYSGPSRVKSAITQFVVDVRPFQVAGEWRNPGVLVLYFVVDNRGNKEKDINIEFDLNRGRSTLTAELLGPLTVPADSVAIYGHEYRLGNSAQKAEIIDARLVSKEGTIHEIYRLR